MIRADLASELLCPFFESPDHVYIQPDQLVAFFFCIRRSVAITTGAHEN